MLGRSKQFTIYLFKRENKLLKFQSVTCCLYVFRTTESQWHNTFSDWGQKTYLILCKLRFLFNKIICLYYRYNILWCRLDGQSYTAHNCAVVSTVIKFLFLRTKRPIFPPRVSDSFSQQVQNISKSQRWTLQKD